MNSWDVSATNIHKNEAVQVIGISPNILFNAT